MPGRRDGVIERAGDFRAWDADLITTQLGVSLRTDLYRTTLDVDVVAALRPAHVAERVARLEAADDIDAAPTEWLRHA